MKLQRKLGFYVVLAIVIGDTIGSGIFFTPGELARVATVEWQVYFIWTLCGLITLCGALTLAELASLLPRAGVFYHSLNEAYGPFAGFMQGWIQILISGPGSIAGIAILFGELASQIFGTESAEARIVWGIAAIIFFTAINLAGAKWGGRTQIILTTAKLVGLLMLIGGGIFLAAPSTDGVIIPDEGSSTDVAGLLRFVGLGVAIVLFTYDGWIDATHIAGEVKNPERTFPRALALGVLVITAVYLLVNFAFLRVLSLSEMQAAPDRVATTVAAAAFGRTGATFINGLMWISIFGALGGLVMTLPRLCYASISGYLDRVEQRSIRNVLGKIAYVSPKTSVPAGATIFIAVLAIAALLFFGSFSRIVNFLLVPLQAITILMISSIFLLRPRLANMNSYRTPGYPFVPLIYIVVVSILLVSAIVFNPLDTAIGIGLAVAGVPFYYMLLRKSQS